MDKPLTRWGVLLTSALAIFIVNVDTSIVNVVLPSLVTIFSTTLGEISLVSLTYLVSLTAFLLASGKLIDIYGPEIILAAGYGVFIISSAGCGLSPSLEWLELFRFIQGLGAAMLFSTSAVIITRYISPDWWGRAYGINGLFACVGIALGPLLGGFIQEIAGWSWIFFVNVPVGLAGLILARILLNKPFLKNDEISFDKIGFLLNFVMLVSLTYTLHALSDHHAHPLLPVTALTTIIAVILFLIYEWRVPKPLLNLRLFQDKVLDLALSANLLFMIIFAGLCFLFPFYFMDILHLSSSISGLYLAIFPSISIVLAYFSGWFADRVGPRIPCIIGMVFCLIAGFLFLGFGESTSKEYILLSFVIFGIGVGLFVPAGVAFIMKQSDEANRGSISGLKSLIIQLGSIFGVSSFTILLSLGISGEDIQYQANQIILVENLSHTMIFVILLGTLGLFACIAAGSYSGTNRIPADEDHLS